MIQNYLKVALRNIKRSKGFSFINIAGLSVGMVCFILIMLFVKYELSYDRYHENADDIYRVVMKTPGSIYLGTDWWNCTPGALKAALMGECPEISRIARVRGYGGMINHENMHNIENRFYIVDPEFLEIFTFPLIEGDPKTALSEPLNLLLTQEMAEKYFGDENPIGKILNLDGQYDFRITGILKNTPANSHFKFDFLASFKTHDTIYCGRKNPVGQWGNNLYSTYIQVRKDINRESFESKFPVPEKKYSGRETSAEFYVQPLMDIHLKSHMIGELEANGDIRYVYLFSAVAFLIMLIACLNYMNLSTARFAKRSKEVGVRKVVGAGRLDLIRQFLGESIVLSFISLSISIVFVKLLLLAFSSFVQRELSFEFFGSAYSLLSLICIAVAVGIVSGIYPAFFLSSFKPVSVIKNVFGAGSKANSSLRNSLVVFQFIISIALLFCTIVIYDQLKYINKKDLGFKKEHIVIVDIYDNNLRRNYEPLKNELLQYHKISDITVSRQSPAYITAAGSAEWEGETEDDDIIFYTTFVDYNFLDFYGIKLLEGRNFSKEITSDVGKAYILNKTAVETIGWEDPVGKRFRRREKELGVVIGVVDDFHFQEFRSKVQPLVIKRIDSNRAWTVGCFSIKISSEDIPGTLSFIEEKYKEFSSDYPFTYSFLDEKIDRMYRSEQRLGKSFVYFTVLAVFIACLGLFGLAAFAAEQRTKEIGIRKVMGASVSNIILKLSLEFVKWVILANIIAFPVGYFGMNKWLQNFAYKIDIGIWTFILSGTLASIIALITVIHQVFKAATANPVDSLRYE